MSICLKVVNDTHENPSSTLVAKTPDINGNVVNFLFSSESEYRA